MKKLLILFVISLSLTSLVSCSVSGLYRVQQTQNTPHYTHSHHKR